MRKEPLWTWAWGKLGLAWRKRLRRYTVCLIFGHDPHNIIKTGRVYTGTDRYYRTCRNCGLREELTRGQYFNDHPMHP